ncbi:hypothetical protein ABZ832_10990 [Streptantibioticus parmotrematis]|uniref:hypothetical protein n=1 Tax=Streptantibioticus parmotrematis TaxID=2873249 RepID=UPI00340CD031
MRGMRNTLAVASIATTALFMALPTASAASLSGDSARTGAVTWDCGHDGGWDQGQSDDSGMDQGGMDQGQGGMDHGQGDHSGDNNWKHGGDDCHKHHHGHRPHGGPHTGLGGSVVNGSTVETAAGAGLIAAAAGGVLLASRRRRTNV